MADKQVAEASQLLRQRLKAVMERQGLKSQEELADYLGISRGTVGPYLWPKESALPTPETLKKLRGKIPEITDADARILETAYSRKASQSRSRAAEKRYGRKRPKRPQAAAPEPIPAMPQQTIVPPSSDDRDAKIGRLVRQLLTEVAQNGGVRTSPADPVALLHSLAAERYQVGDMPSVLTKDNFETLNVSRWSERDRQQFLGYANIVLEESRKCMLLLAQFKPDTIREELLERLARNADLLWRTYKAASSVAPIEYVKDIELARKCEKLVPLPKPQNGG